MPVCRRQLSSWHGDKYFAGGSEFRLRDEVCERGLNEGTGGKVRGGLKEFCNLEEGRLGLRRTREEKHLEGVGVRSPNFLRLGGICQ